MRGVNRAALRGVFVKEGNVVEPVEQLVSAARRGDRAAFGELYRRFGRMVHGLLLARVPAADADDLLHDVFATALAQLPALRNGSAFGSWLAAIARNRAADYHRRTPVAEALTPDLAMPDPRKSEALAILEAIRSLPEAYNETLMLRLVEGLSGPEIAERTGLTPASVRVNLSRGMKQLRARLGLVREGPEASHGE
jgi:RNA polymerase sigma-70 factor (ECF subfamily)